MPLLFMEKKDKEGIKAKVVYEYYEKAGPRAINGMPIFMSCGFLTANDVAKVKIYVERLKKAQEDALKDDA